MGKSNLQGMEEVASHIKKEILTAVPTQIEQLSTENVEVLRSKLHILQYYTHGRTAGRTMAICP